MNIHITDVEVRIRVPNLLKVKPRPDTSAYMATELNSMSAHGGSTLTCLGMKRSRSSVGSVLLKLRLGRGRRFKHGWSRVASKQARLAD